MSLWGLHNTEADLGTFFSGRPKNCTWLQSLTVSRVIWETHRRCAVEGAHITQNFIQLQEDTKARLRCSDVCDCLKEHLM